MSTAIDAREPGSALWTLVDGHPQIDAEDLAAALRSELSHADADWRTRLLIRRGIDALHRVWLRPRLDAWLASCPAPERLAAILAERFDEDGFPSLRSRVVMATKADAIEQYLRELSRLVSEPTTLVIGGSVSAILSGLLSRSTEDIDVPDEVPAALRSRHRELTDLSARYGLHLAHFQSHYLPTGWDSRLRWHSDLGRLRVYLVDPVDLFVGKLFSRRDRDRDDLRAMASGLEREAIVERLRQAGSLRGEPRLLEHARENWFIVFGDALPD